MSSLDCLPVIPVEEVARDNNYELNTTIKYIVDGVTSAKILGPLLFAGIENLQVSLQQKGWTEEEVEVFYHNIINGVEQTFKQRGQMK